MAIVPDDYRDFCSEFYFVERSVEVVAALRGKFTRVRIDVLFDGGSDYSITAYVIEDIDVRPTYPPEAPVEHRQAWVKWSDFPWTNTPSADAALGQALGFLREQSSPAA
jgi:hypothetical protein